MIKSGMTKNATTHGIDSNNVNSIARFCALHGAMVITTSDTARHFGENDGARRNANNADRQLIETVSVIKRRQRTRRKKTCNDRIGKQRKLHAGRTEGRRTERAEELPHVGIEFRPTEFRQHAGETCIASDQQEFEDAGHENAPCGRVAGGWKEGGQGQRKHK